MTIKPEGRHRRSIRLRNYDYTSIGAYFVTIVTQDRRCLFGEIADGKMQLNECGKSVSVVWSELSIHYPGIETDAFVVMPNHVHGIVVLVGVGPCARPVAEGQSQGIAPTKDASALSLPDVIHRYKTLTTKRYVDSVKQFCWKPFSRRVWQRNYFEHVIRDEESLNRILEYIHDNPARWEFDRENPRTVQPEAIDAYVNLGATGGRPRLTAEKKR